MDVIEKAHRMKETHPTAPASIRIAWAREEPPPVDVDLDGDMSATFEFEGFTISVRFEQEQYPDLSFRGEFSNTWSDGAVQNPDWTPRGDYLRWFHPGMTEEEHFRGLSKMGYARGPARDLARSYVLDDLKRAAGGDEYPVWTCFVTASRKGIELGTDALGGIDADSEEDALAVMWWHQMPQNAIAEARDNLKELRDGE